MDIEKQIINHAVIDRIKITKQGRMVLLTQSVNAAIHVLQLTPIANIPVNLHVQFKSITTRFLLYCISVDISSEGIANELIYNGIHVLEI